MHRLLVPLFILLMLVGPLLGNAPAAACAKFDHTHAGWTALLQKHVSAAGLVDYVGMERHRTQLKSYLDSLADVCKEDFGSWSQAEKIAYWINAYNAFTVELILRHYPIDSIRSIGWLPHAAFRESFIPIVFRTGENLSLQQIEHAFLRKEFDEPRIHFALNCASMSCPPLLAKAYVPSRLDRQLEDVTRAFLRDARRNRYAAKENTLHLSKVFDWFSDDFEKSDGSVLKFVSRYLSEKQAKGLEKRRPDIEYLDYDWSLNERQ